ncbi:methionine--tRNA ligase mes1 [Dispira parvispora]|uniref:methionine--tRNA ligase n=1 Tax=Dispira parvispora TaxID=1520584 RepID=A0A9W8E647_9FUNG|nr:methionine--tRNA ligase mes1 [Dispira parvispora]
MSVRPTAITLCYAGELTSDALETADFLKVYLGARFVGLPLTVTKLPPLRKKGTGHKVIAQVQFDNGQVSPNFFQGNAILGLLEAYFPSSLPSLYLNAVFDIDEHDVVPRLYGKESDYPGAFAEANRALGNLGDSLSTLGVTVGALALFCRLYFVYQQAKEGTFSPFPKLVQLMQTVGGDARVQPHLAEAAALVSLVVPAVKGHIGNRKVECVTELDEDRSIPRQPIPDQKNILITSALPYVNNIPHLGNIIGSTLSADVFSRYCRLRGRNSIYICGTDEYGTATETKALEEGVSCQALCDKYHKVHSDVYKWFQIDFDYFGRTTTQQQTEIAQDIFAKLNKNGYTFEDRLVQLYCDRCSRFLADRYVEGTCPKCGYEDARGDQCDKCGTLINAVELVNPRCKLDGNPPVLRESTHIFLDLAKLQPATEQFFNKSSEAGGWSSNGRTITTNWLKEGLKPRCITRDLKWGTPVPVPHLQDKVFYVWYDAPIGYPSITANYTPEHWQKWWKNPEHVKLYQFMGKDNVPFHSVIFPACEIGTGDPWSLVNHISTTEYLNYEGGKFSKSRNIGVFGNNVIETGIPVEVWRYYLISNRPETGDSVFTWKDFAARNNNELLANVGNVCNRVIRFVRSNKYGGVVPPAAQHLVYPPHADSTPTLESRLVADINALLDQYITTLEAVKLRQALKLAMDVSQRANGYLQEAKLDNNLFNNHREQCDTVINIGLNVLYLLSAMLYPFIPSTSHSICRQLNVPLQQLPTLFTLAIQAGHVVGEPEYLFQRIEEKVAEGFKARFGGQKS